MTTKMVKRTAKEIRRDRYHRQYMRRGKIPFYTKAALRKVADRVQARITELTFT